MSLAILMASSKSENEVTDTTGPKISSWKIRIELSPSKMVGCHVVAAGQLAAQVGSLAAGQHLGALLPADVEVGQDLLQLVVGGLRADHGLRVQRVALPDRLGPGHGRGQERRRRWSCWISARDGQVQTSPWLSANMVKPSSALS